MSFFDKTIKWKGTKLIFVSGEKKEEVSEIIFNLCQDFLEIKKIKKPFKGLKKISLFFNDTFILVDKDFKTEKLETFFSYFSEVIMVLGSENLQREKLLINSLSKKSKLLVDFDSQEKLPGKKLKENLSYGFKKDADFYVSDLTVNEKTNFKINYDGASVPVWLEKDKKKEDVLIFTSALGASVLLGLNFVSLAKKMKK